MLVHPQDSDSSFGRGDLCEKASPEIAQKKIEVSYKSGNFGQRWAVNYKVLDKEQK